MPHLEKEIWYKCLDGHNVRSLGELTIDNALYLLNVPHEYEDYIKRYKSNFKYDWYLPQSHLYIEYFGLKDEEYLRRRQWKEDFYRRENLALLAIEPEDLENIIVFLTVNLKRYDIQTKSIIQKNEDTEKSNQQNKIKYCGNCGAEIDYKD